MDPLDTQDPVALELLKEVRKTSSGGASSKAPAKPRKGSGYKFEKFTPPGTEGWDPTDTSELEGWFQQQFGRRIPMGRKGQRGKSHFGWDHSRAVDISLSPNSPEGQALAQYLKSKNIPFQSFVGKVRKGNLTISTGDHFHLGWPSRRDRGGPGRGSLAAGPPIDQEAQAARSLLQEVRAGGASTASPEDTADPVAKGLLAEVRATQTPVDEKPAPLTPRPRRKYVYDQKDLARYKREKRIYDQWQKEANARLNTAFNFTVGGMDPISAGLEARGLPGAAPPKPRPPRMVPRQEIAPGIQTPRQEIDPEVARGRLEVGGVAEPKVKGLGKLVEATVTRNPFTGFGAISRALESGSPAPLTGSGMFEGGTRFLRGDASPKPELELRPPLQLTPQEQEEQARYLEDIKGEGPVVGRVRAGALGSVGRLATSVAGSLKTANLPIYIASELGLGENPTKPVQDWLRRKGQFYSGVEAESAREMDDPEAGLAKQTGYSLLRATGGLPIEATKLMLTARGMGPATLPYLGAVSSTEEGPAAMAQAAMEGAAIHYMGGLFEKGAPLEIKQALSKKLAGAGAFVLPQVGYEVAYKGADPAESLGANLAFGALAFMEQGPRKPTLAERLQPQFDNVNAITGQIKRTPRMILDELRESPLTNKDPVVGPKPKAKTSVSPKTDDFNIPQEIFSKWDGYVQEVKARNDARKRQYAEGLKPPSGAFGDALVQAWDWAILGADKIRRGYRTFDKWIEQMELEEGPRARMYGEKIFDLSQRLMYDHLLQETKVKEQDPRDLRLNSMIEGGDKRPVKSRLIPLYHGTGYAYHNYEPSKDSGGNLFGKGYYMTTDPSIAGSYAKNAGRNKYSLRAASDEGALRDAQFMFGPGEYIITKKVQDMGDPQKYFYNVERVEKQGPNIRKLYAMIKNPLDLKDESGSAPRQLLKQIDEILAKVGGKKATTEEEAFPETGEEFAQWLQDKPVPQRSFLEGGNREILRDLAERMSFTKEIKSEDGLEEYEAAFDNWAFEKGFEINRTGPNIYAQDSLGRAQKTFWEWMEEQGHISNFYKEVPDEDAAASYLYAMREVAQKASAKAGGFYFEVPPEFMDLLPEDLSKEFASRGEAEAVLNKVLQDSENFARANRNFAEIERQTNGDSWLVQERLKQAELLENTATSLKSLKLKQHGVRQFFTVLGPEGKQWFPQEFSTREEAAEQKAYEVRYWSDLVKVLERSTKADRALHPTSEDFVNWAMENGYELREDSNKELYAFDPATRREIDFAEYDMTHGSFWTLMDPQTGFPARLAAGSGIATDTLEGTLKLRDSYLEEYKKTLDRISKATIEEKEIEEGLYRLVDDEGRPFDNAPDSFESRQEAEEHAQKLRDEMAKSYNDLEAAQPQLAEDNWWILADPWTGEQTNSNSNRFASRQEAEAEQQSQLAALELALRRAQSLKAEQFSAPMEDFILGHPDDISGKLSDFAQWLGYDGLTHTGGKALGGKNHDVWIAFSPDQIVPATYVDGFRAKMREQLAGVSELFKDAFSNVLEPVLEGRKPAGALYANYELVGDAPQVQKIFKALRKTFKDSNLAFHAVRDNYNGTRTLGLFVYDKGRVGEILKTHRIEKSVSSFLQEASRREGAGVPYPKGTPERRAIDEIYSVYDEPAFVQEARRRLRETIFGANPLNRMMDLATTTGYDLYHGGVRFSRWAREMINQLGHKVEPLLKGVWDKIQELNRNDKGYIVVEMEDGRKVQIAENEGELLMDNIERELKTLEAIKETNPLNYLTPQERAIELITSFRLAVKNFEEAVKKRDATRSGPIGKTREVLSVFAPYGSKLSKTLDPGSKAQEEVSAWYKKMVALEHGGLAKGLYDIREEAGLPDIFDTKTQWDSSAQTWVPGVPVFKMGLEKAMEILTDWSMTVPLEHTDAEMIRLFESLRKANGLLSGRIQVGSDKPEGRRVLNLVTGKEVPMPGENKWKGQGGFAMARGPQAPMNPGNQGMVVSDFDSRPVDKVSFGAWFRSPQRYFVAKGGAAGQAIADILWNTQVREHDFVVQWRREARSIQDQLESVAGTQGKGRIARRLDPSLDEGQELIEKAFIGLVEEPYRVLAADGTWVDNPQRASNDPRIQAALEAHDRLTESWRQYYMQAKRDAGQNIDPNWGITERGYFRHLFLGDIQLFVDNEFQGVVENYAKAEKMADDLLLQNPGSVVRIQARPIVPRDPTLRISSAQYEHVVSALIGATPDGSGGYVLDGRDVREAMKGSIGKRENIAKFFGAAMRRKGAKGWLQDYDKVMSLHSFQLARTQELTRLRRELEPHIKGLKDDGFYGLAEDVERQINDLWGVPLRYERWIGGLIRSVPQLRKRIANPDLAAEGAARKIAAIHNAFKLKYNPKAIFLNYLQPLRTLYPYATVKDLFEVIKQYHDPAVQQMLVNLGVAQGGIKLEAGGALEGKNWKDKLKDPFTAVSGRNRSLGYIYGKILAEREGLQGFEAHKKGMWWAGRVEFDNSKWNSPMALRHAGGIFFGQYKGYLIKDLENTIHDVFGWGGRETIGKKARANRIAKWAVGTGAVGGVRAATSPLSWMTTALGYSMYLGMAGTIQSLTGVSEKEAKEYAAIPWLGMPELMGLDLSSSMMTLDAPTGQNVFEQVGRFVGGPTVTGVADLSNKGYRIFDPAKSDKRGLGERVFDFGTKLSPYARQGQRAYQAYDYYVGGNPQTITVDNKKMRLTGAQALGGIFGAPPSSQSLYYEEKEATGQAPGPKGPDPFGFDTTFENVFDPIPTRPDF